MSVRVHGVGVFRTVGPYVVGGLSWTRAQRPDREGRLKKGEEKGEIYACLLDRAFEAIVGE